MELRNCNIALRDVLGGAWVIFLIAAGVSLCTAGAAHAQAADGGGAPSVAYAAIGDGGSDGNVDVPAPAADYDVPADSAPYSDRDTGAVAGSDSRVLELPQLVDPASYAVAAPANANPEPADSNAALANAEATLNDADAALTDADDSGQPGSIANAAADGSSGVPIGDTQDYENQADSGSMVVYAAPVYLAPMPYVPLTVTQPGAIGSINGRLPMYSALYANRLPIYSGRMPVGPGRYQVGGGTRLFNSRLGQGFVIPHGPMAMGGFAHAR